jgi:hypothetical protein
VRGQKKQEGRGNPSFFSSQGLGGLSVLSVTSALIEGCIGARVDVRSGERVERRRWNGAASVKGARRVVRACRCCCGWYFATSIFVPRKYKQ